MNAGALLILVAACSACASPWLRFASDSRPSETHTLPLRRVRLYASGMGYFERRGQLHGRGDTLPIPSSHLDDALKSLVLLSPGEQLASVTFASRLSPAVARARAGLAAEEEVGLSYDRLLASLRGEEVEVRVHGKLLRGRVVEVLAVGPTHPTYAHSKQPRPEGQEEPEVLQLLLLGEKGELMTFDAHALETVRPLNPSVVDRLKAAMAARLSSRSGSPQTLALGSSGAEEIALAYLAEAPVWRPSYRLMMGPDEQSARLQGWALVHNDTDESWQGVRVELANGHPESFLFPLSAPRYERRELHTPDRELSSLPQLSTATPDAMWGDFSDYAGEEVETVGGRGTIGHGAGGGSGYGYGSGGFRSSNGLSSGTRPSDELVESSLLILGDLSRAASAEPEPPPAVSVFSVPRKLVLPPHHSALLPFIESTISTLSLVWFSSVDAEPERAIAIRNDTPNSLSAGPLAVFDEGGFQGEAEMDDLEPGERRFARIGRDFEVELKVLGRETTLEEQRLTFESGELRVHLVRTSKTELKLVSRSDRPREVYLALSVVKNAAVTGPDRLDYDRLTSTALAVFQARAGASRTLRLVAREGLVRPIVAGAITSAEVEDLINVPTLPEAERNILRAALSSVSALESVGQMQDDLDGKIEAAVDDVTRLREHLTTLTKGDAGAAQQQLVARILEREEELHVLKAKKRLSAAELARKRKALSEALGGLTPPEGLPGHGGYLPASP